MPRYVVLARALHTDTEMYHDTLHVHDVCKVDVETYFSATRRSRLFSVRAALDSAMAVSRVYACC